MRGLILGLVVLCASCANAIASPVSYVTTSTGQFGTVDLANGAFSQIALTPGAPLSGLATGADGTIYGMNALNQLVKINPANGATTIVGPSGVSFSVFAGLAGGALYGVDATNALYSVNATT